MKYFKIKIIVITIFISSIFFTGNVYPSQSSSISDIQKLLHVSEDTAIKLLKSVAQLIRNTEVGISTVADNEYPYEDKIGKTGLISGIVHDSFSSNNAKIYVSSRYKKTENFGVERYLRNLAGLSQSGKYDKVKIYFDEGMQMSNINNNGGNTKMGVDVFQFFEGCKIIGSEKKCYRDITKKTFIVKIDHTYGDIGDAKMVIDALAVKDTYTLKDGQDAIEVWK